MNKRVKIYPGWKLTDDQHGGYFYWLGLVYTKLGLRTQPEKEAERKRIHVMAFGDARSAKLISHLDDYDDFKAAIFAILHPDNLELQMKQAQMKRTRRLVACRRLAPEGYIVAEAARKFGLGDWTGLSLEDLTILRNHLQARAGKIQWPATPEAVAVVPSTDVPF